MIGVSKNSPVGFFDSGLGGLCILDAFKKLLPFESTVYIADRINCPYGNKSPEEIIRFSDKIVKRLLSEYRVKMVVVACNTATASAIDYLRKTYTAVPFIGLELAIKPAVLESKSKVVGVLATQGTFNGRLYKETSASFAGNTQVIMSVADEFVQLVERREINTPQAEEIVRSKIEPLLKAGADHIVLGCTHFPHLRNPMEKIIQGRAQIVEPSLPVAKQARNVLEAQNLLADKNDSPTHLFIENLLSS
jgi:glutamate racemase